MSASGMNGRAVLLHGILLLAALTVPDLALAQTSPFLTGANSLQTNILAWATPIAIILVMALGIMAMCERTASRPPARTRTERDVEQAAAQGE